MLAEGRFRVGEPVIVSILVTDSCVGKVIWCTKGKEPKDFALIRASPTGIFNAPGCSGRVGTRRSCA